MKNLILLSTLLLTISSCYKNKMDEPMVVKITSENPITHSPYPNILFTIYEVKNPTFGGNDQKTEIYSGKTDENGNATYQFDIPENYKWTYEITFDYSKMDVPENDYYMKRAPNFQYLQRGYDNVFDIQILPYAKYYQHIKNVNCNGQNDKMRWRSIHQYTGSGNWSIWHTSYDEDYILGCYDSEVNRYEISDIMITEMEIIKNNIKNNIIDTFYINPTKIDTLKLYY